MCGAVLITAWSKIQSNIALSTAEAELNSMVKAMSESIGILHLMHEIFTQKPRIRIYTDATACKGIVLRHGSGKIKHLSTKQLWTQEAVVAYGMDIQRYRETITGLTRLLIPHLRKL